MTTKPQPFCRVGALRAKESGNVFGMTAGASSIGTVIREMRQGAGLTLKAVASNAGTSIAYLSKVERGEHLPSREYAVRVLNFITSYEIAKHAKAAKAAA